MKRINFAKKGERYGKLLIKDIIKEQVKSSILKRFKLIAVCVCDCGNTCEFAVSDVVSGRKRNCGCIRNNWNWMNPKVGEKVGRLLIISVTIPDKKNIATVVKCKCDCGNTIEILARRLWRLRSCGCIFKEKRHGLSHTKLWNTWQSAKGRCYNEKNEKYPIYGGRGIIMCEGLMDFRFFVRVMGEPPTPSHSIDRIDNNMNYSCGECEECKKDGYEKNVHWGTIEEQANNKSSNRNYIYKGETLSLSEICRRESLPFKTIYARLTYSGWDLNKSLNTPIKKTKTQ